MNRLGIVAFTFAVLIAGPVQAGIGSVVEIKGNATKCEINRGKNNLPGQKGAGIESMDAYVTGNCASSIKFNDNTDVKITENSKLVIDEFVYDPKQSDAGKLAMKVTMGTVRYASGQIAKSNPQRVAIKTPTATIAVRGTDFSMVVDETGQSTIILLPSCKDPKDVKTYELEEQRCKVGSITVTNDAGSVVLDQAFMATYVSTMSGSPPLPPVVLNTIEGRINNNLIIVQPQEVVNAYKEFRKNFRQREDEDREAEAIQQMNRRVEQAQREIDARVLELQQVAGDYTCNPTARICVNWDQPTEADMQNRGKGIAYRVVENEHYAEVKTQGYNSNTTVSITQNDNLATEVIGNGDFGGNIINIKQNTGTVRRTR